MIAWRAKVHRDGYIKVAFVTNRTFECIAAWMKSAKLSYHAIFPDTPISGRAGARWLAWVPQQSPGGQYRRPRRIVHPFLEQRKLWCLLSVHFQGVDLRFAMPLELDLFVAVMSRNPLPSGRSLVPDCAIGRPKRHWLARLPKEAKPWKFRKAICEYLAANETVRQFRAFYETRPLEFQFEGIFDSYLEAHWSSAHGRTRPWHEH